jgi:hypothetical protein
MNLKTLSNLRDGAQQILDYEIEYYGRTAFSDPPDVTGIVVDESCVTQGEKENETGKQAKNCR